MRRRWEGRGGGAYLKHLRTGCDAFLEDQRLGLPEEERARETDMVRKSMACARDPDSSPDPACVAPPPRRRRRPAATAAAAPTGHTSTPSCLSYLDSGLTFVGSRSGDCQLVRISPTPVNQVCAVFVSVCVCMLVCMRVCMLCGGGRLKAAVQLTNSNPSDACSAWRSTLPD